MVPFGVIVLSLVTCTYTATESTTNAPIMGTLDELHQEPETKHITSVEDIQKIEAKDGLKKRIKGTQTALKPGQLDRGFVSDLINSTLSGVQMGLSIGSKNGTTNQLCIKLGNIALGGCRRTAGLVKEISSDHNRTQTLQDDRLVE